MNEDQTLPTPKPAKHAPDRNLALELARVTEAASMAGVRYQAGGATTDSLVMRSRSGTIRSIKSEHQLWKLQAYSSVNFD